MNGLSVLLAYLDSLAHISSYKYRVTLFLEYVTYEVSNFGFVLYHQYGFRLFPGGWFGYG